VERFVKKIAIGMTRISIMDDFNLDSMLQSFYSYGILLENPNITVNHKTLHKLCMKCYDHCKKLKEVINGKQTP